MKPYIFGLERIIQVERQVLLDDLDIELSWYTYYKNVTFIPNTNANFQHKASLSLVIPLCESWNSRAFYALHSISFTGERCVHHGQT